MQLVVKDTEVTAENLQPIFNKLLDLINTHKQSYLCKEYIGLKIQTEHGYILYQISIKEIL